MNTTTPVSHSPSIHPNNRRGWIAALAAGAAVGAIAVGAAAVAGGSAGPTNAANAVAETTTTIPTSSTENGEYPRTITVSGHGSVKVKPHTATLSLGVSVTSNTANDALRKAATKADALIKALAASGVADDDIVTDGLSLYPQYDDSGDKVVSYNASNNVTATVRKIDTTGAVLDAAAGLVGDEISIGGVSFSLSEDNAALSEARKAATADAKQHADDLTSGVDATVGQVLSIDESTPDYQPYYPTYSAADTASGSVATPIQTGTQDITVDVSVTFELK